MLRRCVFPSTPTCVLCILACHCDLMSFTLHVVAQADVCFIGDVSECSIIAKLTGAKLPYEMLALCIVKHKKCIHFDYFQLFPLFMAMNKDPS